MMNQPGPPKPAGRMGGVILQVLLVIFTVTNFLTFILSAITACHYAERLARFFMDPDIRSGFDQSIPRWTDQGGRIIRNPIRFVVSGSLPYILLAAVAAVMWIITSITLLFLITKARQFSHRVARYVFRIVAVATVVILVVFYLTWARSLSFEFPWAAHWGLAKATVIVAHINLLIGIFLTLIAAVLDTPKDWDAPTPPSPPPTTGPSSRQPSHAGTGPGPMP
ncbi:hypothetical protein F53441_11831 [Fusarium austroafricanum]|uniref:Uncharacterized protein n=1 Tax=Fusarium austroafricanum TaxID=2364996 RepID=A0A8H4K254_9HYPO|nr:hypothetical protein F53441_11831 [Fusarium austroafricanum]